MNMSSGKKVAASFLLMLAIVTSIGFSSNLAIKKLIYSSAWQVHTYQVISKLDELFYLLKDTETGQRGFVMTGDEHYLESYIIAIGKIEPAFKEIQQLTVDNPVQQQRLVALRSEIAEKLAVLAETFTLEKTKGFASARKFVMTDEGRKVMVEIRALVDEMSTEETRLLARQTSEANAVTRNAQIVIVGGCLLTVVLLMLTGFLLGRNIAKAEEVQGRLAAIIEGADDAIISNDLSGIIRTWNWGAGNMFRYKAEEVIGKHVSLLVPPGHTDEVPEILARIKQGGHIDNFETVRMRKDGTTIPVSLTFSAVKDANAVIIGVSEIAHDITARKKAEEGLQKSEAKFRTLFETMTEGFALYEVILDDEGKPFDLRYLSVNPAFERHTGLKAGDIEGRTVRELFPEAKPVWFERYGKEALNGELMHFEERFGPLNRWFEVSVYQTEPGRFAVVFFDLTERKLAEERTYSQLQKLSALHSMDLTISSSLDISMTLKVFVDHVVTQLSVDAANVLLLNRDTRTLEYAAGRGSVQCPEAQPTVHR